MKYPLQRKGIQEVTRNVAATIVQHAEFTSILLGIFNQKCIFGLRGLMFVLFDPWSLERDTLVPEVWKMLLKCPQVNFTVSWLGKMTQHIELANFKWGGFLANYIYISEWGG